MPHAPPSQLDGRRDDFVHVPIPLAVAQSRTLDPVGEEWQRVLEATGQPGPLTLASPDARIVAHEDET